MLNLEVNFSNTFTKFYAHKYKTKREMGEAWVFVYDSFTLKAFILIRSIVLRSRFW